MTLIAEQEQIIIAYSFDHADKHLIGSFEYHWAIGTGLAAHSTNLKPPVFKTGQIPIFSEAEQKWTLAEDHRLKTVYSTETKLSNRVDYIGPIKEGYTLLEPSTEFDSWNGTAWVDVHTEEEKLAYKRSQYPSLTRYQFLRCLLENGYQAEDIETQILSIEDEFSRQLALLGFKEATNFVRTDESILAMQSVLNLTDERVDEMWEYALTL